jgi:hypothetical protein
MLTYPLVKDRGLLVVLVTMVTLLNDWFTVRR